MRYTKEELAKMAEIYLKKVNEVFATTDGHFFYKGNEAKTHAEKNKVEHFAFKKPTKKAE